MTIRIPASSPEVSPLKQSVPGLSQPGSCSLSSTHAAASTSVSSTSNSLEGYMRTHGQPLPPLGLGSCDLQSKSHQVRSPFLSFCPFHVSFSFQSRTAVSASCRQHAFVVGYRCSQVRSIVAAALGPGSVVLHSADCIVLEKYRSRLSVRPGDMTSCLRRRAVPKFKFANLGTNIPYPSPYC